MADLKTRLFQLLDLSASFQRQLLADLDPAERSANGTWEQWVVKDELAHVIAWQLNSLARLAALIHHEAVPDFSDFESINRSIYDANRDRTLDDIMAEGDRAHAGFRQIIESWSEADLSQPARFSDQEQRSVASEIIGNGYEHPALHCANYYWRHGDLARATEIYETSVAAIADLPERYGVARYNLACFYALSGQLNKSVLELQAALQLRPDLREWSRQDADLVALHDIPAYQALYS